MLWLGHHFKFQIYLRRGFWKVWWWSIFLYFSYMFHSKNQKVFQRFSSAFWFLVFGRQTFFVYVTRFAPRVLCGKIWSAFAKSAWWNLADFFASGGSCRIQPNEKSIRSVKNPVGRTNPPDAFLLANGTFFFHPADGQNPVELAPSGGWGILRTRSKSATPSSFDYLRETLTKIYCFP